MVEGVHHLRKAPNPNPLLTHWGRVTHICITKLTIIGLDNGLSPCWRQAIVWTNAGVLLIGSIGANFSEIVIEILKVSSAKWRPFCLGLNGLMLQQHLIWAKVWNNNRPFEHYYSHLAAVRGHDSISCMYAGTLGFAYMEIYTVKYIFVYMKQ